MSEAGDAGEVERGITAFAGSANSGLVITAGLLTAIHRDLIIAVAARHHYFVDGGGLLSYGTDVGDHFHRAAGRTGTDTRSELGARFHLLLALYPTAVLSLRARLAWAHDWVSDPTLAALFQTLPGASFVVNGATPAKNSALASAGAEYRLANGVTLLAKFDGEFAAHSSTYAGTGTDLRYAW